MHRTGVTSGSGEGEFGYGLQAEDATAGRGTGHLWPPCKAKVTPEESMGTVLVASPLGSGQRGVDPEAPSTDSGAGATCSAAG